MIAAVVAMAGTWLIYRLTATVAERFKNDGFRWGQIGSAALFSLAHGMNDAQKTIGIITLALIASGQWHDLHSVPLWVKAACATAIALGTFIGGWRIIRTLGKGLVEIDSPQGMAAESASAATIIISSHLGFALSMTHVATGSILGTGLGRKGATVRWGVALRMVVAWLITLPSAGLVAAVTWGIGNLIGGVAGATVVFVILVVFSAYMFWHSRKNPVGHHNVNDDWEAAPDQVVPDAVKEGVR